MAQTDEETRSRLAEAGWKPRQLGGFIDQAGPLWARKEDAGWAYAVLAEARHLNPVGVVHGGLLETLIDHTLSALAWEAAGRVPCVTLQLDTHFVASARAGQFIEARGRVLRRTGSLVFMQGGLSVDGQDVLAAQAIVKIVRA